MQLSERLAVERTGCGHSGVQRDERLREVPCVIRDTGIAHTENC